MTVKLATSYMYMYVSTRCTCILPRAQFLASANPSRYHNYKLASWQTVYMTKTTFIFEISCCQFCTFHLRNVDELTFRKYLHIILLFKAFAECHLKLSCFANLDLILFIYLFIFFFLLFFSFFFNSVCVPFKIISAHMRRANK